MYLCRRVGTNDDSIMTAIELRTSINADLDVLNVELLEHVSRYVDRLASHVRRNQASANKTEKRKIRISSHIRQMSGKFNIPDDVDYKELKADLLEDNYKLV